MSDRFDREAPEVEATGDQHAPGDPEATHVDAAPTTPADERPAPPETAPPPTEGAPSEPPPREPEPEPPPRTEYTPAAPTQQPPPTPAYDAPWPAAPQPSEEWPRRPERYEPPPPPEKRGLNPLVRLGVPQPWRGIIDWIVTIAGAIAIVLAIKAWVVNPYRIPSSSMEPTLHCARTSSGCTSRFSDRVLANRFIYHFREPHRGEIIVFDVPQRAEEACGAGGVFVKRIIGLPGDVWQEREGFVYINGKKLDEPYIRKERRDFQSYPRRRIPPGNYFMMGDNRQSSCDSRRWGTVPRKSIIGKVFAIYWPPQRIRLM